MWNRDNETVGAKYTIPIRAILTGYLDANNIEYSEHYLNIINLGKEYLFDFDYPINSDFKEMFEVAFLKQYYMQEIGFETVGLFKLQLDKKLHNIIDTYNKMWLTEDIITDVLNEFKSSKTATNKTDATSASDSSVAATSTESVSSNNKSNYYDAPQSNVGNDLDEYSYLTNQTVDTGSTNNAGIDKSTNTSSATNNVNANDTEDIKVTTNQYDNLDRYRASLINITELCVNEFQDLFMMIY